MKKRLTAIFRKSVLVHYVNQSGMKLSQLVSQAEFEKHVHYAKTVLRDAGRDASTIFEHPRSPVIRRVDRIGGCRLVVVWHDGETTDVCEIANSNTEKI